ncbi:MAG TPA: ABC transporter substrate-binding protein, partial [Pseudonocardiaceae bacterium]|nr:ABC transporter substrate-binding protein [Pseudonocardiaceae bacterium]
PVVSGGDVYVAQQQGFFAKHHLDVTVRVLNGGSAIVPAMESGAVDIGESNVVSVIQGAVRGIAEPCFSGANTDPTSGHYLSLVADGIGTAAGLRGTTVAVNASNGINQLLVESYLDANGVDPHSVHFMALPFPDMPQALSGKRVVAAVTSEPFTTVAMRGGAQLVSGTMLTTVPGNPTYSCWNASSSWLSAHRSSAADFVAAMADTDAWIASHQADFRTIVSHHVKIEPDVLSAMSLPVFTDKLTAADLTAWETAAKKYGLIDHDPAPADVLSTVTAATG